MRLFHRLLVSISAAAVMMAVGALPCAADTVTNFPTTLVNGAHPVITSSDPLTFDTAMDDSNLTFSDAAQRLVIDTAQGVKFGAGVDMTIDMVGEIEFHGDVTFDLNPTNKKLKLSELAFVGSDAAAAPTVLTVIGETLILGSGTRLGIDKNLKVDFNAMGGIGEIPHLYLGENYDTTLSFDDSAVLSATELVTGSPDRRTVIDGSLHLGTGGAPFTQGLTVRESIIVNGATTVTGNLSGGGGKLHFNIPQSAVADTVLLTVDGNANMTGTSVSLDTPSGRPNIAMGDKVILLDVTGRLNTDITTLTVRTAGGDTYIIQVEGNELQAFLGHIAPTGPAYERLKAYAESRVANLAFVNQGLDLLLNRGFASAMAVTSGPGLHIGSFGGLSGGWSRYNSGSHTDVSGMSLLAGLALGNDIPYGRVTLGAFFEGGWGNYTSHNSFSNAASADGKGDTSYYGAGLLGRIEFPIGGTSRTGRAAAAQRSEPGFTPGEAIASARQDGGPSVIYIDASARMGRTESDFRTGDIQYNGWNANFESGSLYYGLHGGLGYFWNFTDKASLDLSAKLLWTRQKGESLTVYQDQVRFKDADSVRTRLGGRFAYAVNDSISPYVGAYWEHEFEGELRSTVNGQNIGTPSLKGDTGIGEIGLTLKPSATVPLSFDLGVQGYTGMREGVTGSLQVKLEF